MAILESKLDIAAVNNIMHRKFEDWKFAHNLGSHNAGRIVLLWNANKSKLVVLSCTAHTIHCSCVCNDSNIEFLVTFTYGLHSISARKAMWATLVSLAPSSDIPWLIMGDFNNITSPLDRIHGADVSAYEIKDFNDCCTELALSNLNAHGSFFTWSNGRIWSKIDIAVCNLSWNANFINSTCEITGFQSVSDHAALIINTNANCGKAKQPFRFNNAIAALPQFLEVVSSGWDKQFRGCKMWMVCKKLKELKGPIKSLANLEIKGLSLRIDKAELEYNNVLLALQQVPNDPNLLCLADTSRHQIMNLRKAEHFQTAQIMKNRYLIQADRCTAFFHAYIKRTSHARFIAAITLQNGQSTSSQPQIVEAFVSYFSELFHVIDTDCLLFQPFVKQLLKQINHAFIVLIPKTDQASQVKHFRPISCCNILYKIISKILASRIAPVLGLIIGPFQSAFLKNRNMIDNIFLIQELLRKYSRKRISPCCLLKVDLHKAYDFVSWKFLNWMLISIGFPPRFSDWIIECVTTTSFSVVVNGAIHGHFKGGRGLRQGDPLSPYLFVLCLEYLSRDLSGLRDNIIFQFHPACCDLNISHLAFADDIMLLSRGDVPSITTLYSRLSHFCAVSGLSISSDKSAIYSAGMDLDSLSEVQRLTGFELGAFPFRYLGVPLLSSRLNVIHYDPLLSRILGLVQSWNRKTLSYAGKLELIRAVIQGITNFWMGIFPLPVSVINRINAICRNFLWGKPNNCMSKLLVAWVDICSPKHGGGLGLFSLKEWNLGGNIWDHAPSSADSPLFKKIILIRNIILDREQHKDGALHVLGSWAHNSTIDASKAYAYFRLPKPNVYWHKVVWNTALPPKAAFIFWLAMKGKLLTLDIAPFLEMDPVCPLCSTVEESHAHLFFLCPTVIRVWKEVRDWSPITRSFVSLQGSVSHLVRARALSGTLGKTRCLVIALTVYCVWRITYTCDNIQLANETLIKIGHQELRREERLITGISPFEGYVKLNMDGSSIDNGQMTPCGGVIRDAAGNWLTGFTKFLGSGTSTLAEIWGFLTGMDLAWHKGFRRVFVEGDSKVAL
ncbi:uncharacterized protein LOC133304483 [Gastrolobium bilobum]|uniref:uncharacterized protein LOC133304483 n=1 Tax=Gastrolobium bilobum TaxID=150636 RepID=UPI002AAF5D05|nr:uncharacterized protein LOC133304483 [Gastrolobium bilobum]